MLLPSPPCLQSFTYSFIHQSVLEQTFSAQCTGTKKGKKIYAYVELSHFGVFWLVFFAVRGPLAAVASPVAEHRLRTRRLSGHGSRAQPLRGMWDLPGPGHEPVSPALAGGLSTTAPPGKPT